MIYYTKAQLKNNDVSGYVQIKNLDLYIWYNYPKPSREDMIAYMVKDLIRSEPNTDMKTVNYMIDLLSELHEIDLQVLMTQIEDFDETDD